MRQIQQLRKVRNYPLESGKFVEEQINMGMVTALDPTDIPNSAGVDVKNMRLRYSCLTTRPYLSYVQDIGFPDLYNSPDDFRILGLHKIKYPNSSQKLYRFTTDGVRWLNGAVWTSLASAYALGDFDRIQVAVLADKLVFSTNGALTLKSIDSTPTLADVKAGKTYRYITSFYNRIVAANFNGSPDLATKIEWCADGDVTLWEGDHRTAGSVLLTSGPEEIADRITGIKALGNVLLIFRERSLWVGNRQASATAPFTFSGLVNGIGCNLPYTICEVQGGFMWADAKSGTIWYFNGQDSPQPVGRPNDERFVKQLQGISSLDAPQAVYDPVNEEYLLLIPQLNVDKQLIWVYSFRTKTWVYDEVKYAATLWVADIAYGFTQIRDLPAGPISDLAGTIANLGTSATERPAVGYGTYGPSYVGGGLLFYDESNDAAIGDAGFVIESFNFTFVPERMVSVFTSKIFQIPSDDIAISNFLLEYHIIDRFNASSAPGGLYDSIPPIKIYYAINGENIEIRPAYYSFKKLDLVSQKGIVKLSIPLNIRCRQFQFKIEQTLSHIHFLRYELHVNQLGRTKPTL